MKTAICLSGHMRHYEKTLPGFLNNLCDLNNADVFIHTWDERLQPTSTWWKDKGDLGIVSDFCTDGETNPPVDVNKITEAYNPKKILVETPIDFASPELKKYQKEVLKEDNKIKIYNVKSMWYGVSRAFEIMEEHEKDCGEKYDNVIRCRPDLILNEPLDISKYDLEKAWFAMQRHYLGTGNCDIIFFSKRSNMEYACKLYHRFEEFFVGSNEFAKHWGSAERVLRCYLEANHRMKIGEFVVEKTLSLLRVSGSTINFGT